MSAYTSPMLRKVLSEALKTISDTNFFILATGAAHLIAAEGPFNSDEIDPMRASITRDIAEGRFFEADMKANVLSILLRLRDEVAGNA